MDKGWMLSDWALTNPTVMQTALCVARDSYMAMMQDLGRSKNPEDQVMAAEARVMVQKLEEVCDL